MTKSPTTSSPTLPPTEKTPPARWSWGRSLFTLLFRLLLLGVGGSLAAALGVAIAQLYPAQTQEPPLTEKLIQSAQSLMGNVKQLPNNWQGSSEPAPVAPSAPTAAVTPAEASTLSSNERQQLQTELTQLQAELQALTSQSSEPLADRVQEIQQRIQAIQTKLSSFASAPPASETFIAPASSTSSTTRQLMVTLPSDALFATGQTTLKPGTEAIFNSMLTDLQRYPNATIQVGAHTHNQGDATADRQQSIEQAKAVQQFLSSRLDPGIHWVTVGYGSSRPLAANDTPTNQQRNRRIEIVIAP